MSRVLSCGLACDDRLPLKGDAALAVARATDNRTKIGFVTAD